MILPNTNELTQCFESDEGEDEVMTEIERGRMKYNISCVPFFVIKPEEGRPYGLSGAQEKETFLEVFEEFTDG